MTKPNQDLESVLNRVVVHALDSINQLKLMVAQLAQENAILKSQLGQGAPSSNQMVEHNSKK
jgi:hypothetical protein